MGGVRREVKSLVIDKKAVWNEVVEKANADFEGSRKDQFWAFVGRRTRGKRRGIAALT